MQSQCLPEYVSLGVCIVSCCFHTLSLVRNSPPRLEEPHSKVCQPPSQPAIFEKLWWRSCYVMLAQVPWSSSSPQRPPCGSWPRRIFKPFQDFHKQKFKKRHVQNLQNFCHLQPPDMIEAFWGLCQAKVDHFDWGLIFIKITQNYSKSFQSMCCFETCWDKMFSVATSNILTAIYCKLLCNLKSPAFCNGLMPFHSSSFHSLFHMSFVNTYILD